MCDVDARAANACDVCGTTKRPDVWGTPEEACEKCFQKVSAEAEKRVKLRAQGQEADAQTAADSTAFAAFLERTAAVLFKASPGLKPKIIVVKAFSVWEAVSDNPDFAEVVEEMTKRTEEGTDTGKFLERTVPKVFEEIPNLKPKIIVDKAVAMWEARSLRYPDNSGDDRTRRVPTAAADERGD